jgi:hypothetical protein
MPSIAPEARGGMCSSSPASHQPLQPPLMVYSAIKAVYSNNTLYKALYTLIQGKQRPFTAPKVSKTAYNRGSIKCMIYI